MSHNSILIVGSIALDTIETPVEKRSNVLGGSTTYSLVASGRQSEVSIVGIVGNDFPSDGHSLYQSYASDLSDLKIAEVVDVPNMLVTMHFPKSITNQL